MASVSEVEARAAELRLSAIEVRKPYAAEVTPRMCAYIRAYHEQFGSNFSLNDAMDLAELPKPLMKTYKVVSGKFDDRSILSTMLIDAGLLVEHNEFREFEITSRGMILAQILANEPELADRGVV